jgi:hypothetical protein
MGIRMIQAAHEAGAQNLCHLLAAVPAEPLLVWSGNGHASKEAAGEWIPMGVPLHRAGRHRPVRHRPDRLDRLARPIGIVEPALMARKSIFSTRTPDPELQHRRRVRRAAWLYAFSEGFMVLDGPRSDSIPVRWNQVIAIREVWTRRTFADWEPSRPVLTASPLTRLSDDTTSRAGADSADSSGPGSGGRWPHCCGRRSPARPCPCLWPQTG